MEKIYSSEKILKLFIGMIVITFFLSSCSQHNLTKTTVTEEIMDTYVTITIYSDADSEEVLSAITEAFSEMRRIEDLFSIYKEGTLAYNLNEKGSIETEDIEFKQIIEESKTYYYITEGAFDITVQAVIDTYSKSFSEKGEPPRSCDIDEALRKVSSSFIEIDDKGVNLLKERVKVTFGGVAKGYAIDRALAVLEDNGITNALVNAGGDMKAIGLKKGKEKWTIALHNPDNPTDFIASFSISDKSIATSGNYERYFDPTKKFHHIVNPKTGYSAQGLISSTIITEKAMDADALATAVFVLGPDKGLSLIEKIKDVEGMIITEDREIIKSSGMNKYILD
jgi:FAD:protein FMN transferase